MISLWVCKPDPLIYRIKFLGPIENALYLGSFNQRKKHAYLDMFLRKQQHDSVKIYLTMYPGGDSKPWSSVSEPCMTTAPRFKGFQ
jgi:hypothetical protein